MGKKKKKSADFRYNTGAATIPWAAVGETINEADITKIVEFLCQPSMGKRTRYDAQLKKVTRELKKLNEVSIPSGKLSLGSNVTALEKEAAKMLRAKYASFVTNATAGFEMAHQYAGLQPGDEIIAPAITFFATISYPLSIGAKVVIADVDPRTLNLDPKDVAKKITRKTKVIMPVHLGGYPVEMNGIMRLARKHKIAVVEDAAHAFGGEYYGKKLGTIGHFGSFSFHEVKNITSIGEGGLLVTNAACGKTFNQARFVGINPARKIKNWLYDINAVKGFGKYFAPGNHSSTEIQALVLRSQIKRLKNIIAKRKKATTYLTNRFKKVDGIIPQLLDTKNIKATYHLYLLQIDPDKVGGDIQLLKKKLDARGVVQIPHFAPLYKFSLMEQLGYNTKKIAKSCPVAEEAFNHRFTHLPLYDFTQEQLKYMADVVIDSVKEMKKGR
ncbi:MAG: DegT/DnrJ/EryC1/StrS family aminotransferase [Planctomycetota bacterium]|jgi:dTDP-4-amino-4,6-dideoxygalactose transaminase